MSVVCIYLFIYALLAGGLPGHTPLVSSSCKKEFATSIHLCVGKCVNHQAVAGRAHTRARGVKARRRRAGTEGVGKALEQEEPRRDLGPGPKQSAATYNSRAAGASGTGTTTQMPAGNGTLVRAVQAQTKGQREKKSRRYSNLDDEQGGPEAPLDIEQAKAPPPPRALSCAMCWPLVAACTMLVAAAGVSAMVIAARLS